MNQEIDNKLLISVLNEDQKSINIFVDLCQNIIFGALKTFDQLVHEDKQDVLQTIFQKKIFGMNGDWSGIKRFRGDSKFSSFLYQITRNEALSFLKSKGMKYKPKTTSIDQVYHLFNTSSDIDDHLSLKYCLSQLKNKEQKIMNFVSQGYKQREIADKINEKPNTIAAIISRANRKLKKCMQDN